VSQSKLAKKLELKALPRFLMGPQTASTTAGLRHPFLKDQIASGQLRTVVMVPGFLRIHTDTLENWYEELPSQCLTDNEDSRWPIQFRIRSLHFSTFDWLKNYAQQVTRHAVKAGYLIAEPCAFCGNSESQAHHPSYDTPLHVIWFCKRCHPIHHHRLWSALKLIAKTGGPAQLELFPKSWLSYNV
jgi:hypothetical protein